MLKVLILVLLIAMLTSLFSGFYFLFRDQDVPESRRVLYALGIRVSIAATLLILVYYGLATGQLGMETPWHHGG
jgi:hypothetical protein